MNFETAVKHIFKHEGGLVDHPKDPGGITNLGISLRAYPDLGRDGIRNLKRADAEAIYKRDYWDACRCDDLPDFVRLMVFDCAVNQGVGAATRLLQSAAGAVVDGKLGDRTIQAANKLDRTTLLHKLSFLRFERYKNNPNWNTFGSGWMNRLLAITVAS